jgi:hypothetical protein
LVFFSRKPIFLRHAISIRTYVIIIPFMLQAKRIDVYVFFLTTGQFFGHFYSKIL